MIKPTRILKARPRTTQAGVLKRYEERFQLTKWEADSLRLFFSPERVPKGLTKNEVKLIIEIYPLLGQYRATAINTMEEFLDVELSYHVSCTILPEELTTSGRMTRKNFREGMKKLLYILTH